jgi:hypothetical protein
VREEFAPSCEARSDCQLHWHVPTDVYTGDPAHTARRPTVGALQIAYDSGRNSTNENERDCPRFAARSIHSNASDSSNRADARGPPSAGSKPGLPTSHGTRDLLAALSPATNMTTGELYELAAVIFSAPV